MSMIRNRYNRIPPPVLGTKWENNTHTHTHTHTLDGIRYKASTESQEDSSFPADYHGSKSSPVPSLAAICFLNKPHQMRRRSGIYPTNGIRSYLVVFFVWYYSFLFYLYLLDCNMSRDRWLSSNHFIPGILTLSPIHNLLLLSNAKHIRSLFYSMSNIIYIVNLII